MSDVDWHNIKADECDGSCSIKMNDAEPIVVPTEPKIESNGPTIEDCKNKAHQTGGIVTKETRALIGNDDPHAFIPLEKLKELCRFNTAPWFSVPANPKCMDLARPIKYELVDPTLPELKFATEGSVGMDLYTRQDEHIPPFAMGYKIPLNVKVDMPSEIWLMLACRSSFPMKYPGLFVSNSIGVIDSDYRSEICLLVSNLTSEIKFIHRGTKIAQLIAIPSVGVKYEKVEFVDPNPEHKGFGSTDKIN